LIDSLIKGILDMAQTLNDTTYWTLEQGDMKPDTPIVLVLHYMSGTADSLRVLLEGYSQPIRAVFLQGKYPCGEGYSWYPQDTAFYNLPEAEQAPDILQVAEEVAGFLREYRKLYPGAKTAVTGMSQGGDLSLALAVYYPDLIDLAVPLAGRVIRPETFAQPADILPKVTLMNGTVDEIVTIESAREALRWLRDHGFDAELREYENVGHGISRQMVSDLHQCLESLISQRTS
jgi:predicted esterase